ncbi:alpha/beta hydrolase [Paraburkholderia panacisoli]|uniref:Alpha/beta hydrolase n=1 Tax=Paraburkholderia panacisoli TaxID=2603818 RepID=A0A5B0GMR9_9BURK|nr:alpha/beta hydrolase [Paraburkholderia panacisoli]KAA1003728.1 alpha/beta hydrolase [Paraburkholderia panacisoli]
MTLTAACTPSTKRPPVPTTPDNAAGQPEPYFREAGVGPGVVCLHSNASTSGQWRALIDRLAPQFHVFAPDSYGAGKSPQWPSDRVISLRDEMELIEPVLSRAGSPLALIGHSYGAAVAFVTALANPRRVHAMALYEPTLFSLIDAETPAPNEAEGIRKAVADASVALDAGHQDAAAERFIDYWMGTGSWKQTPELRKSPIVASVTNVRRWAHALFTEPTPLTAFRSLDIPVLYMVGKRSTPSAHGVARLLTAALPRVEVVEFENLGHMGPITDPDLVNDVIAGFLERVEL